MRKKNQVLDFLGYILGFLFSSVFIVAIVVLMYQFTLRGYDFGVGFTATPDHNGSAENITLTIEPESSVLEVGRILEKTGLIGNAYIYTFEAVLSGASHPFPGGTYTLSTDMDKIEITRTLRNLNVASDIVITIKEGWTVKDIAEYLESMDVVSAEEFMDVAQNASFDYDFVRNIPERENRLEGYLFPDTYNIAPHFTSEQIINRLLARFNSIYDDELRKRTELLGLTMDDVVIKASIVEKEIVAADERELASAVIYNRLERNMRLEMCSTVLYVLDKRKAWLLLSDLEVESPYNTYINGGLPVGPISNPGAACIRAVLYPADVDYLFFVVRDEEAGEHFFTNNYDEFLAAKARYNQRF